MKIPVLYTKIPVLYLARKSIFYLTRKSIFYLARKPILYFGNPIGGVFHMKTTLVIMAAGLGSRYGGDKQTTGIGPHGEPLMEYSIYDAIRAGFRKVVFIIRPESKDVIEELFGKRLARFRTESGERIEIDYAFQDFSSIPDFYRIPPERKKPFGTAHALLCAENAVREPFCVINADDYYGADAYRVIHDALTTLPPAGDALMVGYILKNTLSESGTVSRGICEVENGILKGVTERLKIGAAPSGGLWDEDSGVTLSPDDIASMNMWGFAPSIFPALRRNFEEFLRNAGDNPKAECYLPSVVDAERAAGRLTVRVLRSAAQWFGMTYQEDSAYVAANLKALHDNGFYPETLLP